MNYLPKSNSVSVNEASVNEHGKWTCSIGELIFDIPEGV